MLQFVKKFLQFHWTTSTKVMQNSDARLLMPMHKEAHHLSDVKKTTIGVILRLREKTNKRLRQKLFSTSKQEANCWTSCSWFQTLYLRLIIIIGKGRDFCPTHTQPPFYKQWVTQFFLSVFRYSEQWHHRYLITELLVVDAIIPMRFEKTEVNPQLLTHSFSLSISIIYFDRSKPVLFSNLLVYLPKWNV